jgi:hypothetical protein
MARGCGGVAMTGQGFGQGVAVFLRGNCVGCRQESQDGAREKTSPGLGKVPRRKLLTSNYNVIQ